MKQDTIASKVGRPPKFKTPLELAEVADAYFESCDNNPIEVSAKKTAGSEQSAKNGSKVKALEYKETVPTPYTIEDFCDFANISDWTMLKKTKKYQTREFLGIIHAIELRIRGQQIRGSLVGLYNANLTARINGIAEKTESKTETKQDITVKDETAGMTFEQKKRLADLLEDIEHERYMEQHYGKDSETDTTD